MELGWGVGIISKTGTALLKCLHPEADFLFSPPRDDPENVVFSRISDSKSPPVRS
jgi:hypothetical protein